MKYRQAMWLAPLLLIIHNLEEYLTMSAFISRHLEDLPAFYKKMAMSSEQFTQALIIVTVLAVLLTFGGSISEANGIGMLLAVTTQAGLLINAVQHIAASIWLGTYTPGVITSIFLYLPVISYLILRAFREGYISKKLIIYSFILGIAMLLPVILLAKYIALII
ncbi:MAG: HXXEE domain-containing protein [Syntrophomonas sp.]|nr:HXXEE domain-containing protein [Syntrophomonas sp.]